MKKLLLLVGKGHCRRTAQILHALTQWEEFCLLPYASQQEEFLDLFNEKSPSIVLLDLFFPPMGGLELGRNLRRQNKSLAIWIMVSGVGFHHLPLSIVNGYLDKRKNVNSWKWKILQDYWTNKVQEKPLDYIKIPTLSHREQLILSAIATGKTSLEIASLLDLPKEVVQNHRKQLFRKFNASNAPNLVAIAAKWGLINRFPNESSL